MKKYLTTLFTFFTFFTAFAQSDSSIFDNNAKIEKWLKENKVPTLGLGIIENGKLKQIKIFAKSQKTFQHLTTPFSMLLL